MSKINESVADESTPDSVTRIKMDQNEDEKMITIIATNDIHGGIESRPVSHRNISPAPEAEEIGGMDFLAGVVQSIRKGLAQKYGSRADVLLLDAGDQFQGTLISNHNEGELAFASMNAVGYDAAVPGNHDYDFGPTGWLEDQVTPQTQDQNPRGVIERLASKAGFPLLSANVYLKSSLVDSQSHPVTVESSQCKVTGPLSSSTPIQWDEARRLPHFSPYLIKTVAGVRVAIVGLDHPETPTMTTPKNVSDLCFRDELETYEEVRKSLEGKAEIFILVLHDGDADHDSHLTRLIQKLASKPNQVHAVISGHTHFVMNTRTQDVAIIQSGANGERFGRIDLIWNTKTRSLEKSPVAIAGIGLYHHKCDEKATHFCSNKNGIVSYEDIPVVPNKEISDLIRAERQRIAPLADRKLGTTAARLTRNRTEESPLSNMLTDAFRTLIQAEISFLNTGGLRNDIPPGEITYEDLFRVLPFNNHAVVIGPMPWSKIFALLQKSVQTCGRYGALMQSGLRVEYSRDCSHAEYGVDHHALVQSVTTIGGEVLFNRSTGLDTPADRTFRVATLDFLASGGSYFGDFRGVPMIQDFGIFREILADQMASHPTVWVGQVDHRWVEKH